MSKLLIFDFDGTIANTKSITYLVYDKLHHEYGLKKLSKEEIDHLKEMSLKEKLDAHGVKFYELPKRIKQTKKIIHEFIDQIEPNSGMIEVLRMLKDQGYILSIVSSNNESNINYFLDKYDINFFDLVIGNASFHGKKRKIKEMIKTLGFSKDDSIYIGDEIRDIKASSKLGIKMIAVTFGFDDESVLEKHHPDEMVDDAKSIILAIENIVGGN